MQREHVSAVWVQMFTRGAAGTDDGTAGAAAAADASATSEASWASSAGGGAAGGGGTSVALFAPPLSPSPAGDGGTATFFLAALQGTHFLLEPGLESCFLHRPRKTLKEVHPVAEHMPRAPCLLQTPRRIATEVQSRYEQDPYAPCLMQRPSAADGVWQPSAVQITVFDPPCLQQSPFEYATVVHVPCLHCFRTLSFPLCFEHLPFE